VPDVNLNQLAAADLARGSELLQPVPNPYYGEIPASSSLGAQTIALQQLLRPFPRFTSISLFRNNIGNSIHHAFQAHLERRFARGVTFTVAFTFSKLIDDASSVFDAAVLTGPVANYPVADSFNRHLERDLSAGDIPCVFSTGFVYELPTGRGRRLALHGWRDAMLGGWQIAGIVRAQSGVPVAVVQQPNFNSFAGFGTQRPNRVADANLANGQRTLARYFNTDAFQLAPRFTIGKIPSAVPVIRRRILWWARRFRSLSAGRPNSVWKLSTSPTRHHWEIPTGISAQRRLAASPAPAIRAYSSWF
jgi:hypothetical protein